MTDRENFLERWSRRKHKAAKLADTSHAAAQSNEPQSDDDDPPAQAATREARGDGKVATTPASPPATTPEFDLASLPSLDSITAATDVRVFLKPGVPPELAREALRRAWAADPVIRNFVGLQEYDWDFNDPTALPGFGALPADYDLEKMVAEVFGHRDKGGDEAPADDRAAAGPQNEPQRVAAGTAVRQELGESGAVREPTADKPAEFAQLNTELVQDSKNIASQNDPSESVAQDAKTPRKHGGALPQ